MKKLKKLLELFTGLNIAFQLLIIELIIPPFFHALASGYFNWEGIKETYSNGWLHFFSLLIYILIRQIHSHEEKRIKLEEEMVNASFIQSNQHAIDDLKDLHYNLPKPIGDYSRILLRDALREINNSTHTLLTSGARAQTLTQKIEIIKSLINECKNKNIERFWATCYDLPSTLWDEFQSYFKTQAEHLPNTVTIQNGTSIKVDKSRVVILTHEELESEINNYGEKLREFIKWHNENGFELRFLLNYNHTFEKKTHSIVKTGINESDYLTDFAIIGNSWIYGESTLERGSPNEMIDKISSLELAEEIKNTVIETLKSSITESDDIYTLKLYSNNDFNNEIWNEYEKLYYELWHEWHHNQWPMMSVEQVISEIDRIQNLKLSKNARIKYYNEKYPALVDKTGNSLMGGFFEIFRALKDREIIATDLLSLKVSEEYDRWQTKQYMEWLTVNCNLVKNNNCNIERIYIFNKKLPNKSQAINKYNLIFKPQIEAGIKIRVANYKTLIDQKIAFNDFVYVEDELCVSTQWHEDFEANNYCIENNFDSLIYANFYNEIFSNLVAKSELMNAWSENEIIQYLIDLKYPITHPITP